MKTVKELENQLKISKVSIYNYIKRPEFKNHIFKGDGNVTLIDETGEALLQTYYLREQSETIQDVIKDELEQETSKMPSNKDVSKAGSKDTDDIKNIDIIMILQEQLKIKDNQINNLLNVVLNQQQLQGAQLLTDKSSSFKSEESDVNLPKKGFFQRLFAK